jgi:hypothetical protein
LSIYVCINQFTSNLVEEEEKRRSTHQRIYHTQISLKYRIIHTKTRLANIHYDAEYTGYLAISIHSFIYLH